MTKAKQRERQAGSSTKRHVAKGELRARSEAASYRISEPELTPGQVRARRRKAQLLAQRAAAQSIALDRMSRGEDFLGRTVAKVEAETVAALTRAHASVKLKGVRFEDALRVAAGEGKVYGPLTRSVALVQSRLKRAREEQGIPSAEALALIETAIEALGGVKPRRGGWSISSGPVAKSGGAR